MPTYAYACKDCGHRFDIVQAFTDDALTSCPECTGALKKVWGSVGVVFKGSGFYRNDSRNTTATSSSPSSEKSTSSDKSGGSDKSTTSESSTKSDSSTTASSTSTSSSSGSAA